MPDADAGTIPLANQRSAFAVPDDVAYFNTASLSPMLHRALDAGHEALRRRAAPWTIDTPDWFSGVERLRGLVAGLFGGDAEGVALVPASSYGLATVAATCRSGRARRSWCRKRSTPRPSTPGGRAPGTPVPASSRSVAPPGRAGPTPSSPPSTVAPPS